MKIKWTRELDIPLHFPSDPNNGFDTPPFSDVSHLCFYCPGNIFQNLLYVKMCTQ